MLTRRKRTKVKKTNKPPRKGHASLKKKYQKICKRECKKNYPIDLCGYKDNIWCENKDGLKIKHNLSKNDNLRNMALITSKNHRNQTLENLIQKINPNKTIRMGSVGCKIASIIRGESDLYISLSLPGQSSPKDWDFAAPEALIKAAGGAITNLDNQELSYGKLNFEQGGIIIASNNAIIHKNICFSIREIIEKNQIYPI